jgi:hypothetical protein
MSRSALNVGFDIGGNGQKKVPLGGISPGPAKGRDIGRGW